MAPRSQASKKKAVRTGQGSVDLKRAEFAARARRAYQAGDFLEHPAAVEAVVELEWTRYDRSEKFGETRPAGPGCRDPKFDVGVEWLDARDRIARAKREHDAKKSKPRILVVNGSPRSDNTCPSEMSKSHRLSQVVIRKLKREGFATEYLDLSRVTSEFGRTIHPCKGCVSTAMPLCHFPCSCYPNYALGQVHDWMNEIYAMWTRAHGVMIVTPVHWYSPTSVLKLMMDRMVCTDGGNTDYTSTRGKDPELAKRLERRGWKYPKHLDGRAFAVVTHGDSEGVGLVKHVISSWLLDLGLVPAANQATLDRYIGYYELYADSHAALDADPELLKEVSLAAELLGQRVHELMKYPRNQARSGESASVRPK